MLYKFKSKATADLVMLQPNAEELLKIIGKAAGPTGIITVAQASAAIAAIQAEIQRYIDEELLPRMKREYDGARVELECGAAVAALNASEQAAITALVRALTQDQGVRKVAYGTEAGQFAQAGIPAVLCGPGSIERAHKVDEYVEVEQLAQCDRFLHRVAESLCR